MCLAEEREHLQRLDLLTQDASIPGVASRAAAHVPLPRITMSKSAAQGEIPFCQRRNTARKAGPAGGVGAVYRRAVPACQTQFGLFLKVFPGFARDMMGRRAHTPALSRNARILL